RGVGWPAPGVVAPPLPAVGLSPLGWGAVGWSPAGLPPVGSSPRGLSPSWRGGRCTRGGSGVTTTGGGRTGSVTTTGGVTIPTGPDDAGAGLSAGARSARFWRGVALLGWLHGQVGPAAADA